MDAYAGKPIADVERDTGLPRATIRIWERRYGFPAPERDDRGERRYPAGQVAQLAQMARLVERGHRPAKLIAAGAEAIAALHDEAPQAASLARPARGVSPLLRVLTRHDASAVRRELAGILAKEGLAVFASRSVPALNVAVGQAWAAGELQVHEEHLYSDCLVDVMRPAIARLDGAVRAEAPVVLLTTFPGEPHGIGLLLAQAMFALQGCRTVSLGVRLPIEQIAAACEAHKADLVGLSFTGSQNGAHVVRDLLALRAMLSAGVRIWAGGSAPVLAKRKVTGVRAVVDAADIPDLLAEDFALPPR